MNAFSSSYIRVSSILFLITYFATFCIAQDHDFILKTETFDQTSDSSTVDLQYIELPDSSALRKLAESLSPEMYPLVVVKKDVFIPGISLVKGLELQLINYQLKDKEWENLDTINQNKIKLLKEVAKLERARVDVQKEANADLNTQIDNLDRQLRLSSQLTEASLKGRNRKNITIGILGGVIGFSLGTVLAVFAGG